MSGMNAYTGIVPSEIKRIRKKLKLTQKELAEMIDVSKPTVERWERGNDVINGPVAPLLYLLDSYPKLLDKFTLPPKQYPLRIKYMYEQRLCTVIDVDDRNREIKIKNYTDDSIFCAFGVIQTPSYEDYEEFLESRCFPRTRDKMKIMLEMLDIPYYDPLLIIEKTQGRMAEDRFWLKLEYTHD